MFGKVIVARQDELPSTARLVSWKSRAGKGVPLLGKHQTR